MISRPIPLWSRRPAASAELDTRFTGVACGARRMRTRGGSARLMDFNKLSANDRIGAIAAAVVVVAGLVAALTYGTYAIAWIAVLAALAMLFVIFQPQIAANASLPGNKGSLMLLTGGIAGVIMVLALLVNIRFTFNLFGVTDVLYLLTVAAALVMAWVGWQEFQAGGRSFQVGMSASSAPSGPSATAAAQPPPTTVPPTSPPPPATPEPPRDDTPPGA
jgi:hypothetical protein